MRADYDDVAGRLRKEAFRAAHTIKGICQNLSLTELYQSAAQLSDRLRDRREYDTDLEGLLEQLDKDYTYALSCIGALTDEG